MDDRAYPPVPTRYELPAREIPANVRGALHPWIAGYVRLTPAQATERLHKRWQSIARPSLLALRKVLGDFEVRAIVDHEQGMI